MKKDLKEKISKIKALLSTEQKTKEIVELENISENSLIIEYLESIGSEEFQYKTTSKIQLGKIQEKGGVTFLWYKKKDGGWIIKLWELKSIEK
jgi:hypothetical protein